MTHSLAAAMQALGSAQLLADHGDPAGAVSRAYYACFYAARAVLDVVAGIETRGIKTHNGLIRMFSLHIVKPGLLSADVSANFAQLQDTRILADYAEGESLPEDARDAVERAGVFVAACRALVEAHERKDQS